MSHFDDFVKDYLSPGAREALEVAGVRDFASVSENTFGQLSEMLGHDNATRLWGKTLGMDEDTSPSPEKIIGENPEKVVEAILRMAEDMPLLPEEVLAKIEKVIRENPEKVAEATLRAAWEGPSPDVAQVDSLDLCRSIIQHLSHLESSCKLLLARLEVLEKKVQAYEARRAQPEGLPNEFPDVEEEAPSTINKDRVGQVREQGGTRARKPIGTE